MDNLTEEQQKMLKNMGALGYDAATIAAIMDFEEDELERRLEDDSSEIRKFYNAGRKYAQYLVDLKLFEMAQSGDIKAIEKIELRQGLAKVFS
jgi:hypothetical protein